MTRSLEVLESQVSGRTRWHFIVLREEGRVAVGECSDGGPVSQVIDLVTELSTELRGRDLVTDREAIIASVTDRVTTVDGKRSFTAATVMGGLEQMLSDHAAQAAGQPIWKWLGGSAPDPVPVYANINRMPGGRDPDAVASMARQATSAGFAEVKFAPFDVEEPGRALTEVGLMRLRAIRAAIGDDIGLMVDCHERLTMDEVLEILPDLEDLGVSWLEDAVSIDRVDDLAQLRRATTVTLAGGELMFGPEEASEAVRRGVIDVLMPDVKHAGGISRVWSIAKSAPQVAISPHNPSGPVATAASAHLFAVCPNTTVLEYQFGEAPWRSELVGGTERIADGRFYVDDSPGLGAPLDTSHPSIRTLWSTTV